MLRRLERIVIVLGASKGKAWLSAPKSSTWECVAHAEIKSAAAIDFDATIEALRTLMSQVDRVAHRATVTVVLGLRYCPALMVELGSEPLHQHARAALAAHRFRQTYGISAETWSVQVDSRRLVGPAIAYALDRKIPLAFATAINAPRYRLDSIVPASIWAPSLDLAAISEGWVATSEDDGITLIRLVSGHAVFIEVAQEQLQDRSQCLGLINRSAFRQGISSDTTPVLLWSIDRRLPTSQGTQDGRLLTVRHALPCAEQRKMTP